MNGIKEAVDLDIIFQGKRSSLYATVALSNRIGLIFASKAGIRGNVHKKPPEIRCAFQTNRYLKGFGLFLCHYEVTNG